jgi:hypothetical protein
MGWAGAEYFLYGIIGGCLVDTMELVAAIRGNGNKIRDRFKEKGAL